jgi:predicted nucleic acid-binding protein
VVVDASVVVALLVQSARTASAERMFSNGDPLVAPDLLFADVANVLLERRRAAPPASGIVCGFFERLRDRVRTVASSELVVDAFQIARDVDLSIYGAFYLALARREQTPVATFDERFIRTLAGTTYASLAVLASSGTV